MKTARQGFMDWLDRETRRRGLQREVDARFEELMVEQQLADLRRRRGISQAELARTLGVSQALIGRLESGRAANLTLATICRTAAALGGKVDIRIRTVRRSSRAKSAPGPKLRGAR